MVGRVSGSASAGEDRALCAGGASRRHARRGRRRTACGFTLVELLNFIALLGLVSGIAMYALSRYVKHSKTLDAIGSLNTLAKASATYYEASDATQPVGTSPDNAHAMRHFPPSSTRSVPPSLDDVRGKRYQSAAADWAMTPWHELQFSIPQPQYYAYSYASEGAGTTAKATARAQGDLDGDGTTSNFSITIAPDAQFRAQAGPIVKEDPDE
jgi:type II secretory pathway pseudopilin PulG